ncbi:GspE/PulE family protein [Methylomonas koyamae]|uniref:Pilus assembly protein PilB n=1 Tax=Methylomonas koyamae TaxID=702114 RepID=A0A291IME4_9GAMM|nr:GspE/PulE family protein [Methylomonas koyamae]ATG91565.1 pilus assembly protein PilB [Methylomonas koyamae]OAI26005.1 pilus assembly protein PilB [Methylomonas koyamae]
MAINDEHLLEAGLRCGLVEAALVERLRLEARRQRLSLLAMVQAHYRFPLAALYRAVAEQYRIPYIDLDAMQVETALLKKIPPSLVQRKLLLPVGNGERVLLACGDPGDRAGIDSVQRLLGQTLPLAMADLDLLRLKIARALAAKNTPDSDAAATAAADSDLVAVLDGIIREAYFHRASDIHLLPDAEGLRVRLRVDGKLRDFPLAAGPGTAAALVSRVKVLAGLDIAEQRMPQDGGFSYHLPRPIDKGFNIRVATAPTRLGERITLRLLGQETFGLTLADLGMMDEDLLHFRKIIHRPYGMVLLTGPTGSGKSTTLFAALQEINRPDINIMTVENPIEYVMHGVSQVQTGPKIGFADALRSFLRHDPDVLMVGEIRDHETADVAVKAAMTGHLVFSTLHTNNAVSAVTRLIDIGCEPFLIGSTVAAVIAQRLVRRLCPHCRRPRPATPAEQAELGRDGDAVDLYEPGGCVHCQGSGFRGRLGLFETLWLDEPLARLVARGADEETLEAGAGERLSFMWEDGCRKVLLGMTTLDEVRDVAVRKTRAPNGVS